MSFFLRAAIFDQTVLYASTITSTLLDTSVLTRELFVLTVTHALARTATILITFAIFRANQLFATATWVRFVIIGTLFDTFETFF